jgi:haloacetate dehalogenase
VSAGFTLEYVDVGEVMLRVGHGGHRQPAPLLHGHPRTHTTWHRELEENASARSKARCPRNSGSADATSRGMPARYRRASACLSLALKVSYGG